MIKNSKLNQYDCFGKRSLFQNDKLIIKGKTVDGFYRLSTTQHNKYKRRPQSPHVTHCSSSLASLLFTIFLQKNIRKLKNFRIFFYYEQHIMYQQNVLLRICTSSGLNTIRHITGLVMLSRMNNV